MHVSRHHRAHRSILKPSALRAHCTHHAPSVTPTPATRRAPLCDRPRRRHPRRPIRHLLLPRRRRHPRLRRPRRLRLCRSYRRHLRHHPHHRHLSPRRRPLPAATAFGRFAAWKAAIAARELLVSHSSVDRLRSHRMCRVCSLLRAIPQGGELRRTSAVSDDYPQQQKQQQQQHLMPVDIAPRLFQIVPSRLAKGRATRVDILSSTPAPTTVVIRARTATGWGPESGQCIATPCVRRANPSARRPSLAPRAAHAATSSCAGDVRRGPANVWDLVARGGTEDWRVLVGDTPGGILSAVGMDAYAAALLASHSQVRAAPPQTYER